MRFCKSVLIGLFVALVVCAVALPEAPPKAQVIDGIGKAIFVVFGILCLGYFLRFRRRSRSRAAPIEVAIAGRPVVVDGSNVMHWGGEPSLKVLTRVLAELKSRGFGPLVYFDANVGYKLFDKHVGQEDMAKTLGLEPSQVVHAPSRTPADVILLERATKDDLPVVTNDRFLDWKTQFPKVGEKGFLIKGMWKEGNVILLGLGRA